MSASSPPTAMVIMGAHRSTGSTFIHLWALLLAIPAVTAEIVCFGKDNQQQTLAPSLAAADLLSISSHERHSCALLADRTVTCWGSNLQFQSDVPTGLANVLEVSVGSVFSCALTQSGTVTCWGTFVDNNAGWTIRTDVTSSWSGVKSISCGHALVCALFTDGSVACEGDNAAEQTAVPSDLGPVDVVSAGMNHVCAVQNGAVRCWGRDRDYSQPPTLTTAVDVYADKQHTCALLQDGTLRCWGDDGTTQGAVTGGDGVTNVRAFCAGVYMTCVAKKDGTAQCWGDDGDSEVSGLNSAGLTGMDSVSCGKSFLCAASTAPRATTTTTLAPAMSSTWTSSSTETSTTIQTWSSPTSTTTQTGTTTTMATTAVETSATTTLPDTSTTNAQVTDTIATSAIATTPLLSSSLAVPETTAVASAPASTAAPATTSIPELAATTTMDEVTTAAAATTTIEEVMATESTMADRTSTALSASTTVPYAAATTAAIAVSTALGTASTTRMTAQTSISERLTESVLTSHSAAGEGPVDVTSVEASIPITTTEPSEQPTTSTSATVVSVAPTVAAERIAPETTMAEVSGGTATSTTTLDPSTTLVRIPATTTTTVTTTTVTSTRTTTTTTAISPGRKPPPPAAIAAAKAEAAIKDMAKNGLLLMRQSGLSNMSLKTEVGTVVTYALDTFASGNGSTSFAAEGGTEVVLPAAMLRSLPPSVSLSVLNIAPPDEDAPSSEDFSAPLAGAAASQGKKLATESLEIAIYDVNGERVKVDNLDPPLLFKLPRSSGAPPDLACSFLKMNEAGGSSWSDEGVWRATDSEVLDRGFDADGVWCFTKHLTLFAALAQVILGCTNLELLSEKGAMAVVENEGWYNSNPSLIVFTLAGCLVLLWSAGISWELYSLRFGRTRFKGKDVSICRRFLTLGPQIIKHKYTAFVVYGRDILRCLTTGRHKLRTPTLSGGVQRMLALRSGISHACVSQHLWTGGHWVEPKASIPNTVLCHKLQFHAGVAEEVMRRDMEPVGLLPSLKRFLATCLAIHPLLDSLRLGAGSLTVLKRATLQISNCFGVLASNAVIFNFSGSLRGWEADAECPIEHTSQLFILVATIISLSVNVVPNAYLMDMAKQVHGRIGWTAYFWIMTFAYMGFSIAVVVIALANLNVKDRQKWHSSLRFSLILKFLVMPAAQALRLSVLLEAFLHEDRKSEPSRRFPVVMGLRHPSERELSKEARRSAVTVAEQSISAEELVKFTALLGDTLMLDFDPRASTAADVLERAIKPLCVRPSSMEEYPVKVEVLQASGLHLGYDWDLICSVLHLGELVKQERPCIKEQATHAAQPTKDGRGGRCQWSFTTSIIGLEPEHAVGFTVKERGGKMVGIACIAAADVLRSGEWSGELLLRPIPDQTDGLSRDVGHAAMVPSLDVAVSQGPAKLAGNARLSVRVSLPQGYLEVLAHHELYKLKGQLPRHHSEVLESHAELQCGLARSWASSNPDFDVSNSGGFCDKVLHERLPPDRMVVHSRQSVYLHLVATVLADAMGRLDAHEAVEAQLLDRDFHGVLDALQEADCQDTRYWIEIFAVDPTRIETPERQEELLAGLPTILRTLRKASCQKMVADIRARKETKHGPLKQLLVLDRSFSFMHEESCLAKLMLAKAMRVRQRLVLHPGDLQDGSVAGELRRLAEELGNAFGKGQVPLSVPYLEDRQAVYDAVKDLVLEAVKEHKKNEGDEESTLKQLDLTDVAIVIAVDREGAARRQAADAVDLEGGAAEDVIDDVDIDGA